MNNGRITLIALLLAFGNGAASAQNFYFGGSLGQSNTKFDGSDYSFEDPALSGLISERRDKTDNAWKLFAGYEFNKYIAVEGGHAELGSPEVRYSGSGPLQGLKGKARLKQSAWFISAKGTLPIHERFNLFGKVGITHNKSSISAKSNDAVLNAYLDLPHKKSADKTGLFYGVGAEYVLDKNIRFRLEYENFGRFGSRGYVLEDRETGRSKTDLWSLGVTLNF
ncbi:MAG: porin family protein [Candidatus Accumulibacter sp.]|jgi:OOP family OmpA-OmpF porin|nr:porin family protein [Accumulibacter sp.]